MGRGWGSILYDKYSGSFNVCNIRNQIFFCVTDFKKKQYFLTLGWSWMLLKLNNGKSYIYFHTH